MISNPPAEVPQATLVTHTNENPEKSTPSAEDGPREGADANDLTSLVQNKSENSLLKAVNLHHVPLLGGSSAEAGPRDDARLEKDRNRTWRMNKKLEELSDFLGIGECILSRFSSSVHLPLFAFCAVASKGLLVHPHASHFRAFLSIVPAAFLCASNGAWPIALLS